MLAEEIVRRIITILLIQKPNARTLENRSYSLHDWAAWKHKSSTCLVPNLFHLPFPCWRSRLNRWDQKTRFRPPHQTLLNFRSRSSIRLLRQVL